MEPLMEPTVVGPGRAIWPVSREKVMEPLRQPEVGYMAGPPHPQNAPANVHRVLNARRKIGEKLSSMTSSNVRRSRFLQSRQSQARRWKRIERADRLSRSPFAFSAVTVRSIMRALACFRRTASDEMLAYVLRLVGRHNPSRTLSLNRPRERLAKVRANDFAVQPERLGESFGSNGCGVRHTRTVSQIAYVCKRDANVCERDNIERTFSAKATYAAVTTCCHA
jgi:hypothetical protein